jgi:hypothetical protein
LEALNGGRQSARRSQSGRSSNFQVILPCFLGSGHWIGGTLFLRLIGSNAASTDVGDDHCIALEGPVSGVNLTLEWIELDPNCIVGNH